MYAIAVTSSGLFPIQSSSPAFSFSCLRLPCKLINYVIKFSIKQDADFQSKWDERLSNPILERIEMEKFFYEIERKFVRENRGSAVDVDIFAAKAQSKKIIIYGGWDRPPKSQPPSSFLVADTPP